MIVVGVDRLLEFRRRHVDAGTALTAWRATVLAASWHSRVELTQTYGSADPAVAVASGRRVAVFNIKGNKYRLAAGIDYRSGIVNVMRVMTHKEYSRDQWKDML